MLDVCSVEAIWIMQWIVTKSFKIYQTPQTVFFFLEIMGLYLPRNTKCGNVDSFISFLAGAKSL